LSVPDRPHTEHELNHESLPVLLRVYRSGQEHILNTLHELADPEQKNEFIQSVNDTNM
jgi:hypothetical protein